ncbi:E3 ubiquitin-protein ligase RNF125 isoform X3 [Manis pentadactyla]|uniref:E3 ubiquitin-protein ligase RNF125 isoform X3 n=1 Tax=Manis pentadactyla TaxID=143292 RepID=UPI00255C638F|nr:E3 ubiquitin-protein ligase RNF125 isoform X3 [Manis pentadactyla]
MPRGRSSGGAGCVHALRRARGTRTPARPLALPGTARGPAELRQTLAGAARARGGRPRQIGSETGPAARAQMGGPPAHVHGKCRFCRSCLTTSLRSSKWTCPYCRAYLPSEGVPATDVARRMRSEHQDCAECGSLVCLSEMRAHIKTCQKYIEKYGPLQELGETAARCVCPFCQRELDEDSLLDHCVTHHRSERRPVDFNIIEEALIRRVLDRSLLEYVNHSNTT